ncbi:uncharacterized protein [Heptranchias perlo]|uniref:uncharacterized protein n=1 Tax=Heptranchias perlo TaxID=212740 RepID=UPI0035598D41
MLPPSREQQEEGVQGGELKQEGFLGVWLQPEGVVGLSFWGEGFLEVGVQEEGVQAAEQWGEGLPDVGVQGAKQWGEGFPEVGVQGAEQWGEGLPEVGVQGAEQWGEGLSEVGVQGTEQWGEGVQEEEVQGTEWWGEGLLEVGVQGIEQWGERVQEEEVQGAEQWGEGLLEVEVQEEEVQGTEWWGEGVLEVGVQEEEVQGAEQWGEGFPGVGVQEDGVWGSTPWGKGFPQAVVYVGEHPAPEAEGIPVEQDFPYASLRGRVVWAELVGVWAEGNEETGCRKEDWVLEDSGCLCWALSFSGTEFLVSYHIGLAGCLLENVPEIVFGASAGSLTAAAVVCGVDLDHFYQCLKRAANLSRRWFLGPNHPLVNLLQIVRKGLIEDLPGNAHEVGRERLFISLTRVSGGQNVLASDVTSNKQFVQILQRFLWNGYGDALHFLLQNVLPTVSGQKTGVPGTFASLAMYSVPRAAPVVRVLTWFLGTWPPVHTWPPLFRRCSDPGPVIITLSRAGLLAAAPGSPQRTLDDQLLMMDLD